MGGKTQSCSALPTTRLFSLCFLQDGSDAWSRCPRLLWVPNLNATEFFCPYRLAPQQPSHPAQPRENERAGWGWVWMGYDSWDQNWQNHARQDKIRYCTWSNARQTFKQFGNESRYYTWSQAWQFQLLHLACGPPAILWWDTWHEQQGGQGTTSHAFCLY